MSSSIFRRFWPRGAVFGPRGLQKLTQDEKLRRMDPGSGLGTDLEPILIDSTRPPSVLLFQGSVGPAFLPGSSLDSPGARRGLWGAENSGLQFWDPPPHRVFPGELSVRRRVPKNQPLRGWKFGTRLRTEFFPENFQCSGGSQNIQPLGGDLGPASPQSFSRGTFCAEAGPRN